MRGGGGGHAMRRVCTRNNFEILIGLGYYGDYR
jgi:hypothetical protein